MTTGDIYFFETNGIKTRPGAGNGLWVFFLLPISIFISAIRHPIVLSPSYKLIVFSCMGLVTTSLVILYKKYSNQLLKTINLGNVLGALLTAFIIHTYLHKDWFFSVISSIIVTFLYFKIFVFVMKKFSECFTFGEAGIASQVIVIIIYSLLINILNTLKSDRLVRSNMQVSTLIIQVGLFGICTIAWTLYMFNLRKIKSIYSLSVLFIFLFILIPLHILLGESPLLWIFQVLFQDSLTMKLTCYWVICCVAAFLSINKQIRFARKASTATRKIFHILAVFIYIPGLIYRCSLLYLASGVVTGLFFALEILRILQVPPLGQHLQDGFVVFSDQKDTGNMALTAIYLLISFSLPIWLHPSPCDITDSAIFGIIPLLSGVLTVGVGDTAASVIGSHYGKAFWPGSKKTIEGTSACIISQIGFIHFLMYFGFIHNLTKDYLIRVYISVFVTSFVEAKTDQVDNLVLPFIMYILLI